jgi:subtilisin family serine protease
MSQETPRRAHGTARPERTPSARLIASTLVLLATVAGCSDLPHAGTLVGPDASASAQSGAQNTGGLLARKAAGAPIQGRLLVTFAPTVTSPRASAVEIARSVGGNVEFVYEQALRGFSLRVAPEAEEQVLASLLRNPQVSRVERDYVVMIDTVDPVFEQTPPPSWGLDRVDQRALPLDERYSWVETGFGVKAFIVDTGIRFDHVEFEGRAVRGLDLIGDGLDGGDCNGHGTHVAGTVGSAQYGVAKGVTLVSVRAFGCGNTSDYATLLVAMDWIAGQAPAALPAVVNLSFTGPLNQTFNDAVDGTIGRGFVVAAAAGNVGIDACGYSPASAPRALTVGATLISDERWSASNHGPCLDVFAPGRNIASPWFTSSTDVRLLTGTSMASPHVAGVAALLLEQNPAALPDEVRAELLAQATQGVVTNALSANNHMVYSLARLPVSPPPPAPTPPSILRFQTTNRSSGPWTRTDVAWTVADAQGLASIRLELLSGTTLVNTETLTLSGNEASGLTELRFRGAANGVRLTVWDVDGRATSAVRGLNHPDDGSGGGDNGGDNGGVPTFFLSASTAKVRSLTEVTLSWQGSSAAQIAVRRDGVVLATVANTGSFTDATGVRGSGSFTYTVCEAGTDICSNVVLVQF